MDADRFDTLTLVLSTGPSRRGILQAIVAAVVGEAFDLIRVEAASTCPGLGVLQSCKTDGDCAGCGNAVCQRTACRRPIGGRCRSGRQCASGSCNRKKRKCRGCAKGTIPCGGGCVSSSVCAEINPSTCSGCLPPTCILTCTCCAGSCSGPGNPCVCKVSQADCSDNHECCTNVCGSDRTCICTDPGGGCVRDAQCCSGLCQVNGRCADFCSDNRTYCLTTQHKGICCPSGQYCAAGECLCDVTNQKPCGGVQCCQPPASCQPSGICLGGNG